VTNDEAFDFSPAEEGVAGLGKADRSSSPDGGTGAGGPDPLLGIVVPTLNEATALPRLLTDLSALPFPYRAVVADGGSTDGTREEARRYGARVVLSAPGRARQMNVGVALLRTPWLLFLHADVRVTREAARALESWLCQAEPRDVGTFRFGLQGDHWFWRFLEFGQALRERVFGLAYGDQGLLVSSERFRAAGGYPEIPLMEDVALLKTLRRSGQWTRIHAPLLSSPRRYEEGGRWRGWLRNTLLISLYSVGVPPDRLASLYPPRSSVPSHPHRSLSPSSRSPSLPGNGGYPQLPHGRQDSSGSPPPRGTTAPLPAPGTRPPQLDPHARVLMVFAKVPEAGRVKTRLGAEVGHQEAARMYRDMGRKVVDQLRNGAYRTILFFDPPNGRAAMERWLGLEGLTFRPQASGDLGSRIAGAFQEVLGHASRAVVVGTDTPGLKRTLVEKAFRCLDTSDMVLGPALDGGYYLLGLNSTAPALFEDIPWSTERVAEVTLDRAQSMGMRVAILPALRDVDTLEDLDLLRP